MLWPFVAEPNLFGESSDTPGREHNTQKGVHGGNMVSPVKPSTAKAA